ncbi:MAG: hypothetical protein AAF581_17725, partial [Planctomycetota bacterium]
TWSLWMLWQRREPRLQSVQLAVATFLTVALVTGVALYPDSLVGAWSGSVALRLLALLTLCGMAWGATLLLRHYPVVASRRFTVVAVAAGSLLGVFLPLSQRGADSSTHPALRQLPASALVSRTELTAPALRLSATTTMRTGSASLLVTDGDTQLTVEPLLTFDRVSLDRFWSLFATQQSPRWQLESMQLTAGRFSGAYDGMHQGALEVSCGKEAVLVAAYTHLDTAVYSHLNSFLVLTLSGRGTLGISFSPCPQRIGILESDYPVGKPARFAVLKDRRVFEVLEARSGEKGPYAELASGTAADELTLTLYDGARAAFAVTLHDWVAQASTQLSPTAGWGVPENSIEFALSGNSHVATIFITLAATSVGRGWDTVGHAAGCYRNRVTVELLD